MSLHFPVARGVKRLLRACCACAAQPPLLIRRALGEDTLPPGLAGDPNGCVTRTLGALGLG